MDDPEAFRVTQRPFEIVEERPYEIAAYGDAFVPGLDHRGDVALEVLLALFVVDGLAVQPVVERGTILGNVNRRQLVTVMCLSNDTVQAFGTNGPVHRGPGCPGFFNAHEAQPILGGAAGPVTMVVIEADKVGRDSQRAHIVFVAAGKVRLEPVHQLGRIMTVDERVG